MKSIATTQSLCPCCRRAPRSGTGPYPLRCRRCAEAQARGVEKLRKSPRPRRKRQRYEEWSRNALLEALAVATWRARALRRELRKRGASAPAKRARLQRRPRPPQPGSTRWHRWRDDVALARRALERGRGGEKLLLANALGALERGARYALSARQRTLAEAVAGRAA